MGNKTTTDKLKHHTILKTVLRIVRLFVYLSIGLIPNLVFSQGFATIFGTVRDSSGVPAADVSVNFTGNKSTILTDKSGQYEVKIPAGQKIALSFSFFSNIEIKQLPAMPEGSRNRMDIILDFRVKLPTVVIEKEKDREKIGVITINPKLSATLPNVTGNFEAILKTLPGVSSNNELSSQYNVRGGNYDENLVYVNDIEIYRPQLVRAGQHEGLSFINPEMVQNIAFSAGGFEARYGDKLSSVLDIKYKEPRKFAASFNGGMLGVQSHIEAISKNNRLTAVAGARYRTNRYVLNSLETKGDYKPTFIDLQSYITYHLTDKLSLGWLSYFGNNNYLVIPEDRTTKFGTVKQALQLTVYFEGRNIVQYRTWLNGLNLNYEVNPKLRLKFITSMYNSLEDERMDMDAAYYLDQLESDFGKSDFGKVKFNRGYGEIYSHIRNQMDVLVFNASHRGYYSGKNNQWQWGITGQHEQIKDKLNEWKYLDSSNFFVPYLPDDSNNTFPLNERIRANLSIQSYRINGYIQNSVEINEDKNIHLNYGLRSTWWSYNKENNISPRLQISMEPNRKFNRDNAGDTSVSPRRDIMLKAAIGYYYQPPFYRELRSPIGVLNPNIKSQRSIHFVLGGDMNFKAWQRPFKFFSEAYYKKLDNLIPYEIEDVRIRYLADKTSNGYATGLDMRVNGEFIKGMESWASLSLLKTREDIVGDFYLDSAGNKVDIGYLRRPTDQRVTFSMFFQDALPRFPEYKMHLNLVFGTSLPASAPGNPRYRNAILVPPYRRVDIGFARQVFDETNPGKGRIGKTFKSLWISLEVFNLLNINNTLSYLWIKDVTNTQYAIPNYLTTRLINLHVVARF